MASGIQRSESQRTGVVEYGLVRHSLIEAVRKGRVRREDVCDAHPELLRAAANLGRPTGQTCPVCDADPTVEVTYVFGAKLPPGGTCPSTKAELARLERPVEHLHRPLPDEEALSLALHARVRHPPMERHPHPVGDRRHDDTGEKQPGAGEVDHRFRHSRSRSRCVIRTAPAARDRGVGV